MQLDEFWSLLADDKAVEESELPMAPTDLVLEATLLEVAIARRMRPRVARNALTYARHSEGNGFRTREA